VIDAALSPGLVGLLTEAETSGGLLFAVALDRAGDVAGAFAAAGDPCAEIGEVVAEPVIRVSR
jgi:selenophosphate synthase